MSELNDAIKIISKERILAADESNGTMTSDLEAFNIDFNSRK